jgi:acyl dehydratase
VAVVQPPFAADWARVNPLFCKFNGDQWEIAIMADKSKIGVKLPTYVLKVERVKIRELMRAIGDDNPIYMDKSKAVAEAYLDTPCPPTYITMAFQEFTGAYLEIFKMLDVPLEHVLHGEEEYEYTGEIFPGDVLSCNMSCESIVEKETKSGPLDLITLQTIFTNQKDQTVLKARSLIIERL